MDPLGLLREFVTTGQIDKVTVKGDRVHFGDKYTFPKSTRTSYKSQQGKGDFYPLDAVLFFVQNRQLQFAQYLKLAREASLASVLFVDRKDLESYLTGQTESSVFIQLSSEVLPLEPAQDDGIGLEEEHAAKRRREDAGPSGRSAVSSASLHLESVLSNEQQLRDRNSMLLVQNKPPGTKVLTIMSNLLKELEVKHRRRAEEKRAAEKKAQAVPSGTIPVKPSARFDRKPEKDKEFQNMGIKPYGYGGSSSDHKREGHSPAFKSSLKPHSSSSDHSSRRHNGSGSTPSKTLNRSEIPIILVPAGMSAKINMFNIKMLLEEGVYCSPEPTSKKPAMVSVNRTIGRLQGKATTYFVTDKPPTRSSDWSRVVGVFCQGVNWQFKDFPFKGAASGDLVDTFSKMLGVFLAFNDEIIPGNVKNWNAKILRLHRDNRHRDIQVVQDFYKYLDFFIAQHKPHLASA